jgi:hypothetical protein
VVAEQGYVDYLYTTGTATQVVPIQPQRVIDTRDGSKRARILNPGNLDGAGRVKAGQAINVDLSDYVYYGMTVFANLTVVGSTSSGYLAFYPTGSAYRRGIDPSSLNYSAGQILSNSAVSGIAVTDQTSDSVTIYANSATHVILDIVAFGVFYPGQINPDVMASLAVGTAGLKADATTQRAQLARKGTPPWQKK